MYGMVTIVFGGSQLGFSVNRDIVWVVGSENSPHVGFFLSFGFGCSGNKAISFDERANNIPLI